MSLNIPLSLYQSTLQVSSLLCYEGNPVDVLIRADDMAHDDANLLQAVGMQETFRAVDIIYALRLLSVGMRCRWYPAIIITQ